MVDHITIETSTLEFSARRVGDGQHIALLCHGFPDDGGTFIPLMKRLAAAGYTTVAPDMRGYGATDRPPLEPDNYGVTALGSDILAVLDALDASAPLVVGHDWGAVAVSAVSRLDPSFADTCVTMAVPPNFMRAIQSHPRQVLRSWYMAAFQVPGVAEELVRRDDFALIEWLWQLWSPGWEYDDERLAAVKDTFRTGETVEAALQYYRSFFRDALSHPDGLAISGIEIPTLLLAGRNDGCIGANLFTESHRCYDGRHRTEIIPKAGHFLHRERPDRIAEEILSFVAAGDG